MSLRSNGSYIGPRPTGPTNGIAGVASGIWDLRTAQRQRAAGAWPFEFTSPTQITGLQLWLDASDASTLYDATTGGSLVAADGAVARWEDKSGNGRHATQSTSGNRPIRKTSIQSGKDVIRFTSASEHGLNAGTTSDWKFLHDGTPSYAVVVLKPGSSANPNALYAILDTGGVSGFQVGFFLGYDDRTGNGQNDALFCSVSAGSPSSGSGYQSFTMNDNKLTPNTFLVCETLISTGASAANRLLHRINGGSQFGGNTDTQTPSTANSTDVLYIGRTGLGSSFGLEGDICEILLYSQQPSADEQTALRDYLLGKWGIT